MIIDTITMYLGYLLQLVPLTTTIRAYSGVSIGPHRMLIDTITME